MKEGGGEGEGEGRKPCNLRHPFPAVPRSLLLNRAETLARQDRVLKNIFAALLV